LLKQLLQTLSSWRKATKRHWRTRLQTPSIPIKRGFNSAMSWNGFNRRAMILNSLSHYAIWPTIIACPYRL